jgi:tRNA(fMet)-specific endonuclease VapC
MKYLLDTDTASYLIRGHKSTLANQMMHVTEWCISSLTVFEIRQGLLLNPKHELRIMVEAFLEEAPVLSFDSDAACQSAKVKHSLRRSGLSIGYVDELLAGQAISRNLTLVSNNKRHFERVEGLDTANWSE